MSAWQIDYKKYRKSDFYIDSFFDFANSFARAKQVLILFSGKVDLIQLEWNQI